jgi:hypothetical protein
MPTVGNHLQQQRQQQQQQDEVQQQQQQQQEEEEEVAEHGQQHASHPAAATLDLQQLQQLLAADWPKNSPATIIEMMRPFHAWSNACGISDVHTLLQQPGVFLQLLEQRFAASTTAWYLGHVIQVLRGPTGAALLRQAELDSLLSQLLAAKQAYHDSMMGHGTTATRSIAEAVMPAAAATAPQTQNAGGTRRSMRHRPQASASAEWCDADSDAETGTGAANTHHNTATPAAAPHPAASPTAAAALPAAGLSLLAAAASGDHAQGEEPEDEVGRAVEAAPPHAKKMRHTTAGIAASNAAALSEDAGSPASMHTAGASQQQQEEQQQQDAAADVRHQETCLAALDLQQLQQLLAAAWSDEGSHAVTLAMWPFQVWAIACGSNDVRTLLQHPAVLLQQLQARLSASAAAVCLDQVCDVLQEPAVAALLSRSELPGLMQLLGASAGNTIIAEIAARPTNSAAAAAAVTADDDDADADAGLQ